MTSPWWAPARLGLPPRSMRRRRACRFSSSTLEASGVRRAPAHASRTTSAFPPGSPARNSRGAVSPRPRSSEPISPFPRLQPGSAVIRARLRPHSPSCSKMGGPFSTRAVVIASGARYRRPSIPTLGDFEGRGVSYWASPIEARSCRGRDVVLVGGGNSAGQGAVFLSGHAARVLLLIRGSTLSQSMSRYLVDRIAATSNIHVHPLTELTALGGNERGELEKVRWKNQRTGVENEANVRHVFLFVGADPATEWLRGCDVALDGKGFVKTGADLTLQELVRAGRRDVPRPLETSAPGVFAIGDGRCGSVKRAGGAIGEGARVVGRLHSYLAELDEQSMGRSSSRTATDS